MDAKIRKQIDESIEKAAALANTGIHPNDAITKVAEEHGYGPDIGRLMARNFNVTKTLAHFEAFKDDYEKRASDFDVADAEVVASRLENSLKKKASKKASVPKTIGIQDHLNESTVDVDWFVNKYCNKSSKVASSQEISLFEFEEYLKHKTKVKEKIAFYKSEAGKAGVLAQETLAKIADLSRDTKDFHTLEADVCHALGVKTASLIFDSVQNLVPFKEFRLKRAEGPSNIIQYDKVVKLAEDLLGHLNRQQHYHNAYTELTKVAVIEDEALPGFSIGRNVADATGQAVSMSKSVFEDITGRMFPEKKEPAANPDLRLDRGLEKDLTGAKASLVLSDILSNDDVLSEEDPFVVSEIARKQLELNPNLLKYPAVLAGAIRRAVATRGDIDSHEGKQLIHIHKSPGAKEE